MGTHDSSNLGLPAKHTTTPGWAQLGTACVQPYWTHVHATQHRGVDTPAKTKTIPGPLLAFLPPPPGPPLPQPQPPTPP